MLFFLKPNKPHCGKMLMLTSVRNCDDWKSENSSTTKHRKVQKPNPGKLLTIIGRLLALFVAIAVAPPSALGSR
jgi:hypothetical protein